MASPLIWEGWSCETLISRLNIVPLAEEPRSTAAGGGEAGAIEPVGGDAGTMPKACSAGSEDTGS